MPHGRQTYQEAFTSLIKHERVKDGMVFARISGTQFGWDVLALEDLTIFDCRLPETAGEDPNYADYEREQEEEFYRGRPNRRATELRESLYCPLVPFTVDFSAARIPTSLGTAYLSFHPN